MPKEFKDFKFCGRRHLPKKENCPSLKQRCRIVIRQDISRKSAGRLESTKFRKLLSKTKSDQQVFVTFKLNQERDIALQIDTGATCNVLPFDEYKSVT